MNALYAALGGALGSAARYFVASRVSVWTGTAGAGVLAVNVIGSFCIGLFLALAEQRYAWSAELRMLVAVGFLGGFTTFSSLAWETRQLADAGELAGGSLNIGANVVLGMLAVYAGAALARAW